MLSKTTSAICANNTYAYKNRNQQPRAFGRKIILERNLRQFEAPFENVINKLSFLLGAKPEHSCREHRHFVEIPFVDNSDTDFFLVKFPM